MKLSCIKNAILNGQYDNAFKNLYGEGCSLADVKSRYAEIVDGFVSHFGVPGDTEVCLFSVPGRSEIIGNHTDHNMGKVIAASISLDIIAVAAKCDGNHIRVKSKGFNENTVSLDNIDTVDEKYLFNSSGLIRGMCDGFNKNGYKYGAFMAYTSSNVLKGSGLSSSAAFEDMIGNILNHLYNNGEIDNVEIAKVAQYSENVHFGKPCGLMDQVACAAGGFVAIDFKDSKNPIVEKPHFDLSSHGYSLCIVNTGGNHADLNEDYASIPAEMKSVAEHFGKSVLREVDKNEFLKAIPELREKCGDRAVMRAMHFFAENERAENATVALKENNIKDFLKNIKASGLSSATMLQNTYTNKNIKEQGIALALAVAGNVLDSVPGAVYRVHGGGFAGTMQAFVPNEYVDDFSLAMESVFGKGSVYVLNVRPHGAVMLEKINK